MGRRRVILLALLVVSLPSASGCLQSFPAAPALTLEQTGRDANDTRDADEFWMVWVHGEETRTRAFGVAETTAVCSIVMDHDLDPDARVLRHAYGDLDPNATRFVIAFDHFEEWGSCPLAYRLFVNMEAERAMGRGGNHTFDVLPNGTLLVDGTYVPLGQRARVTYEAAEWMGFTRHRIHGEFIAENLGGWPRSAIVRA